MENLTTLRNDLISAYEFNNSFLDRTSGDWICAIDPESMEQLMSLWQMVDGSYSLNKLAHAIRKGQKIKAKA